MFLCQELERDRGTDRRELTSFARGGEQPANTEENDAKAAELVRNWPRCSPVLLLPRDPLGQPPGVETPLHMPPFPGSSVLAAIITELGEREQGASYRFKQIQEKQPILQETPEMDWEPRGQLERWWSRPISG